MVMESYHYHSSGHARTYFVLVFGFIDSFLFYMLSADPY